MHIAIVTSEIAPFTAEGVRGHRALALATALMEVGSEVSVVTPYGEGVFNSGLSVARRLSPVQVESASGVHKVIRYDASMNAGAMAYLLEHEALCSAPGSEGWSASRVDLFGAAAAALLGSLSSIPDLCLSIGSPGSKVAFFAAARQELSLLIHFLVVANEEDGLGWIAEAMPSIHRLVVADPTLVGSEREGGDALRALVEAGEAVVLRRSAVVSKEGEVGSKRDAKVAFQIAHGLPVRPEIPLIGIGANAGFCLAEVLPRILSHDLQVVAPSTEATKIIAARYPDRLTLTADKSIQGASLRAMDAFISGEDWEGSFAALSMRAVPLALARFHPELVELDPACQSGCAVLATSAESGAIINALARFLTAFHAGAAFTSLQNRLPGYVPTWAIVAGNYLQLMEEVRTNPKKVN